MIIGIGRYYIYSLPFKNTCLISWMRKSRLSFSPTIKKSRPIDCCSQMVACVTFVLC